MKNKLARLVTLIFITVFLITSCGGPSREIFKMVPETALAVVTVHPGNLLEKGKLQELNFVRDAASEADFAEKILDDPESSGINMDIYSTFFVFGSEPNYGCIIMPLKNKDDFEQMISDIEEETDEEYSRGKLGNYDMIEEDNTLMVYDNSISMILFEMDGWSGIDLKTIAEKLLNLEKEEALLSDKDFNNFLGKQKDINAWFTSNNLNSLPGGRDLDDAMDLFGGIKNNYGHAFMDFQPGNMILTTNLRFNQSMQETIDKYNFLDENAIKDLLKYLPSQEIVFVGNTNVDPERIIDLLQFVNKDFDETFDDIAEMMDMEPDEIQKAFSGEMAFSINGIQRIKIEKDEEIDIEEDLPSFVAATRMKNEDFFTRFLEVAEKEAEVTKINDIYVVNNDGIPVYIILQEKDLILSNTRGVIEEIANKGEISENVTGTDFGNILTKNPVCFFLNLDRESYSSELKNYIEEEMDSDIAEGYERFGDKLKSLSFSANLEEWEFQVVLMDNEENSLYTLLSQIDN